MLSAMTSEIIGFADLPATGFQSENSLIRIVKICDYVITGSIRRTVDPSQVTDVQEKADRLEKNKN